MIVLSERKSMNYKAANKETLIVLRESLGLSQAELARQTGISQGALSNYESGRVPTVEALEILGKFYEVYFVVDWTGHIAVEEKLSHQAKVA